jgi:hypothetical protein
MVTTESLEDVLKNVFCTENKENKKYAEVWLSEADFGGLYQSNKFVLNVKAEHQIESCNSEIRYVTTQLFKKLSKEDWSLIWRVDVYNADEQIHCQSGDILVYSGNC